MLTAKKAKGSEKEGARLSRKRLIAISLVLISVLALASAVVLLFPRGSNSSFPLNAVIIDQLSLELPDKAFVNNIESLLQSHSFTVSYYNKTLDVDFFRGLAKDNYGMIILRVHSALRLPDNQTVDLFTSERFDSTSHSDELNSELLVDGFLNYSGITEHYFAITSKFVENLEGNFPKSIIIAMGCWTLKLGVEATLANAFISKGAKAFIGWTGLVDYSHTDSETAKFLEDILQNKTLSDAVDDVVLDPFWGSIMTYYPHTSSVGNLKLSDLINEAKPTPASQFQIAIPDSDFMRRQWPPISGVLDSAGTKLAC